MPVKPDHVTTFITQEKLLKCNDFRSIKRSQGYCTPKKILFSENFQNIENSTTEILKFLADYDKEFF